MKIIVDAMGGDLAPLAPLAGSLLVLKEEKDLQILLVGNEEKIRACARENALNLSGMQIVHAENVIEMTDPPLSVRSKPDTSLKKGFELLREKKADAFVSAGSTGAIQTGATLFVHRIPGVLRSAIGTLLPMQNPTLLIDSGANASFTPEMLLEYAVMGSTYMEKVCGVSHPRVGLLNIGTEDHKGRKEDVETYALLQSDPTLRFVGNVEAGAVPFGACDVLVTDGFTGNVFLKSVEGFGKYLFKCLKEAYMQSPASKAGALLSKGALRSVKKRFDASELGGAPLLGIAAPVIKAHGNSDARAIASAVKQACRYARENAVEIIRDEISRRKQETASGRETIDPMERT